MDIRCKSETVKDILVAAANGDIQYLKTISDYALRTAKCNSGCTALHWAAGNNQVAVLEYIIQQRDGCRGGGGDDDKNATVVDRQQSLHIDVPAVKKSRGRTPLHYSCRNGCLEACYWLVNVGKANVNATAKHGVTPFQLAIWQNRLRICQWLVQEHDVDPLQVNDFDCGAVHWIGICPTNRANLNKNRKDDDKNDNNDDENDVGVNSTDETNDGKQLLPLAKWLAKQSDMNFHLKQRQGHTALHKAAWGGHLALIRYLHHVHDLWDDCQDDAGNFAADLADMANTPRHAKIARYLRDYCSRARARSCSILGISIDASVKEIRKAYLEKARQLHPDRYVGLQMGNSSATASVDSNDIQENGNGNGIKSDSSIADASADVSFDSLHRAYRHLMEEGGRGNQSNPAHSLNLMLQASGLKNEGTSKNGNKSSNNKSAVDESNDEVAAGSKHKSNDQIENAPSSLKENNDNCEDNDNNENDGSVIKNDHDDDDDTCFKARLIAVLLEYGDKGLDLSNVKKKWKQVWPSEPFPSFRDDDDDDDEHDRKDDERANNGAVQQTKKKKKKKISLSDFLLSRAGDVIEIVNNGKGTVRVFTKTTTKASIEKLVSSKSN